MKTPIGTGNRSSAAKKGVHKQWEPGKAPRSGHDLAWQGLHIRFCHYTSNGTGFQDRPNGEGNLSIKTFAQTIAIAYSGCRHNGHREERRMDKMVFVGVGPGDSS